MLDYELRGTNRVKNQLRFLAAAYPEKTNPVIKKHAKRTQKLLRNMPYPAPIPDSTYVRKGFFGGIAGSFSARMQKIGVWIISNSRPYAVWVIGQLGYPGQAEIHQGRWWVMKDEMEKETPKLVKDLTNFLEEELQGMSD